MLNRRRAITLHQQSSMHSDLVIAQTKKWIIDVVIGCNFCPFALPELKKDSIYFEVIEGNSVLALKALSTAFVKMNEQAIIETLFLLLPQNFVRFADYLKLVHAAEILVKKEGYRGIYQIASFHPAYQFAGSNNDDAANYTNRSPYPMLQILREDSVTRAIDRYPNTKQIPVKNMAFARQKGLSFMQTLLADCRNI